MRGGVDGGSEDDDDGEGGWIEMPQVPLATGEEEIRPKRSDNRRDLELGETYPSREIVWQARHAMAKGGKCFAVEASDLFRLQSLTCRVSVLLGERE